MALPRPDDRHFAPASSRRRMELRLRVDDLADRLSRREGIAHAIGRTDAALVDRVEQLGFSGESLQVLDLLPLVHVAWADGRIQKEERAVLLAILDQRGLAPESEASLLIESLLEQRPSETFFAESRAVLVDLATRTGASGKDVVDLCAKIAEASGGLFGLGRRVTAEERALVAEVADALGDEARARFAERFGS